jgi:hypothetical protein
MATETHADLDAFLDAEDFALDQRRAAVRAASPAITYADDEDDEEAEAWSRQLLSTRACAQSKL